MGASGIIILSFLFNLLAKRTNIPSVLMLILLGVGIQIGFHKPDLSPGGTEEWIMSILEILGNVGLIFIVLEAALDLKLKKEKIGLIAKSFLVALIVLLASSFGIAAFFFAIWKGEPNVTLFTCLMYAVPLSIMSSAIIIPSVSSLIPEKKEFMIYESTFSDILGIMLFYFLKDNRMNEGFGDVLSTVSINIAITVAIAILASYLLVLLFQKIEATAKYFLMFAILMLLYALGKSFHLSSLLIILFFGLVLNNTETFFIGPLKAMSKPKEMKESMHELHVITLETAFVLRTFFFVIFGVTIALTTLISIEVFCISCIVVAVLFAMRYLFLKVFIKKDIIPQLWIAPRGLITVLLFYAIPNGHIDNHGKVLENYSQQFDATFSAFDSGILLYTILITSLIMTVSLIMNRGDKVRDVILDTISLKNKEDTLVDQIENSISDKDDEIYTEKDYIE
ncbi:MAG: cell volume regulation protein A [Flavobacteriales bacterium]|jgi:cell volume regulation protein A